MKVSKRLKRYVQRRQGVRSICRSGFWFVDIPRTSSSSIKVSLARKFGPAYGKTNLIEKEYHQPKFFSDHIPANTMKNILGRENWDKIYKFSIVRNPWDRILSMYYYRLKIEDIPNTWSFQEYVERLVESDETTRYFEYHGYRYQAIDYLLDERGNIIVDEILRYESRTADLEKVGEKIGLDDIAQLRLQAASPDNHCYRNAYKDKEIELVAKHSHADIATFDYTF